MIKQYISIQDAADMSGKSIQTIRRAIKARKFLFKKVRTPQGFNYDIEKDSLCRFYKMTTEASVQAAPAKTEKQTEKTAEPKSETKAMSEETKEVKKEKRYVEADDLKVFTMTLERLIAQHGDERQSFLRLINNLQEKIFVLENQLSLLKAPEKKWFSFWR